MWWGIIFYSLLMYASGAMFTYLILDSDDATKYLKPSMFRWLITLSWLGLGAILLAKYMAKRAQKRNNDDDNPKNIF